MESKKINQLATNVNPQTSDLTTIGDPITGQLKKITWLQVANLIGAQASVTLQQVTDNGNVTNDPITTAGLTLTNLGTGVPQLTNGNFAGTYGYGLANGVATLDSGGKIPAAQLPSSVMEYKGTWNASTNTPTLADGTGDNGDVYLVNVAGTQNLGSGSITFAVGDWVVYNGTIWQKSLNSNAVSSVFGRTGTIVAQEGDYNIDQLGDVAITSAATNDYLRYNGSSWVNTPFPTFVSSDKLVLQVRNNSGATINKGTVVYINGATAGFPTIAKALANDDATSAQTIGMVQDNISNNSNGVVVIVGQITGVDTSAFTAGTQLYLSGTTAGTVTSTKPYAPLHLVYVGIVTTQNAVNGVIEVKVQNGVELEELHNVDALNPNNNDGIFYNSTSELWEHKSIATVLGYTPEQPLTFSSPLVRTTNTISIPAATGSVNGYLTSTDWTTFNNKLSAAITSLNGLTAATQTFAVGTSGTDFNISSSTSTHTFNIPSASATNRGLVTTGTQTFAGDKTFNGIISGTTAVFSGALAGYGLSITNIEDSSQGLLLRSTDADTTLYLARFQSSATAVSTTWIDRFSIAKNGSTVIGDNAPFVNIRLYIKGSDATSSNYALNVADTNGADIVWFRNDKVSRFFGNVGIGKNPSVELDVVGAGSFTGNLSAANLSGTNTGDQTLAGLGGVPTSRTITINGTSFDLSANRTYTVGTIGGSGNSGYVSKFTDSTTIGNSLIYDNGVRAISVGNSSTNSWASPFYVIEGGSYGQFLGYQTNAAAIKLGVNAYFNGSNYIYTNSNLGVAILDLTGDATNASLNYYTAPAGTAGSAATLSPRFIIDSSGNGYFVESLGVGFTSGTPNGKIDFRNPANAIIVGKNTIGGTNTYSSIRLTTANSGGVGDSIGEIRGLSTNVNNRDTALTFLTSEGSAGQTEKLRIAANGAATFSTSATTAISVNSTGTASGIQLKNTGGTASDWVIQSDGGAVAGQAAFRIYSVTASQYRMSIDGSGNVGIGTTSPLDSTKFGLQITSPAGKASYARVNYTGLTGLDLIQGSDGTGYLVLNDNNDLRIYTNLAERMRITSGGNVLINTTSNNGLRLGEKLNVSTLNDYGGIAITTYAGSSAGRSSVIDLNKSRGTSDGSMTAVANGDEIGYLIFRGSDGTNFVDGAYIRAEVEGTVSANSVPMLLKFHTGPSGTTERMRITSGGNVLIGRTDSGLTNSDGVTISDGAVQIEGNGYVFYGNRTASNGLFMGIRRNNVDVGDISVTTTSTSFNTSSDYRLKEDLKDFNALSIINMIKAYDFKWKLDNTRMYGVLAHELQSILPYSVTGVKDGERMQSADYSKLTPILVKAIQEQQAQIEELKSKLN